jgi:hypothetical protein
MLLDRALSRRLAATRLAMREEEERLAETIGNVGFPPHLRSSLIKNLETQDRLALLGSFKVTLPELSSHQEGRDEVIRQVQGDLELLFQTIPYRMPEAVRSALDMWASRSGIGRSPAADDLTSPKPVSGAESTTQIIHGTCSTRSKRRSEKGVRSS